MDCGTAPRREVTFGGEFGDETAEQQTANAALEKDYTSGDMAMMVGAGIGVPATVLWLIGAKGWWWLSLLPLSYLGIGIIGVALTVNKSQSGDKTAQQWFLTHGAKAGTLGIPVTATTGT